MKQISRHLWIVAILFATAIAQAETPVKSFNFLRSDSVDYAALLPDPPAKDSLEQKEEIALILKLQENRTLEQIARLKAEDKFTVFIFSEVLGSWFDEKNMPETKALFEKALSDSKLISAAAKDHWNRDRPPFAHAKVKSALEAEKEGSYPSGHATRGILCAMILNQLDPADHDSLIQRAQLIGWDRVIAGVHYPSDIGAGRTLGKAIFQGMMASPQFQAELEKVRVEFASARKSASSTAARN